MDILWKRVKGIEQSRDLIKIIALTRNEAYSRKIAVSSQIKYSTCDKK
jgi:hypothetical protein